MNRTGPRAAGIVRAGSFSGGCAACGVPSAQLLASSRQAPWRLNWRGRHQVPPDPASPQTAGGRGEPGPSVADVLDQLARVRSESEGKAIFDGLSPEMQAAVREALQVVRVETEETETPEEDDRRRLPQQVDRGPLRLEIRGARGQPRGRSSRLQVLPCIHQGQVRPERSVWGCTPDLHALHSPDRLRGRQLLLAAGQS
jgi:hypothetical protein